MDLSKANRSDATYEFLAMSNDSGHQPYSCQAPNFTVCSYLEESNCQTLIVVKHFMVSISLCLSIVTLLLTVLLSRYKSFSQRIFFNLLIANILFAIQYYISNGDKNTPGCVVQGFLNQTLGGTLFLWICSLAIYLMLRIRWDKDTAKYEWVYVSLSWGLPIAFSFLPLIHESYGPAGVYCWIKNTPHGNIWRFSLFYAELVPGLLIILCLFIYMHAYIRKERIKYKGQTDERLERLQMATEEYLKPLRFYALSFVILNIVPLINRLHNLVECPIFGLYLVHILCRTAYGCVQSALFFVLDEGVTRASLAAAVRDWRAYLSRARPSESRSFRLSQNTPVPSDVDYQPYIYG